MIILQLAFLFNQSIHIQNRINLPTHLLCQNNNLYQDIVTKQMLKQVDRILAGGSSPGQRQSYYFLFFLKSIAFAHNSVSELQIKQQGTGAFKFSIYKGSQIFNSTRQLIELEIMRLPIKVGKVELSFFLKDFNAKRKIEFTTKMFKIAHENQNLVGELSIEANKYIQQYVTNGNDRVQERADLGPYAIQYVIFTDKNRHSLQKLVKAYKQSPQYLNFNELQQNNIIQPQFQQAIEQSQPKKQEIHPIQVKADKNIQDTHTNKLAYNNEHQQILHQQQYHHLQKQYNKQQIKQQFKQQIKQQIKQQKKQQIKEDNKKDNNKPEQNMNQNEGQKVEEIQKNQIQKQEKTGQQNNGNNEQNKQNNEIVGDNKQDEIQNLEINEDNNDFQVPSISVHTVPDPEDQQEQQQAQSQPKQQKIEQEKDEVANQVSNAQNTVAKQHIKSKGMTNQQLEQLILKGEQQVSPIKAGNPNAHKEPSSLFSLLQKLGQKNTTQQEKHNDQIKREREEDSEDKIIQNIQIQHKTPQKQERYEVTKVLPQQLQQLKQQTSEQIQQAEKQNEQEEPIFRIIKPISVKTNVKTNQSERASNQKHSSKGQKQKSAKKGKQEQQQANAQQKQIQNGSSEETVEIKKGSKFSFKTLVIIMLLLGLAAYYFIKFNQQASLKTVIQKQRVTQKPKKSAGKKSKKGSHSK